MNEPSGGPTTETEKLSAQQLYPVLAAVLQQLSLAPAELVFLSTVLSGAGGNASIVGANRDQLAASIGFTMSKLRTTERSLELRNLMLIGGYKQHAIYDLRKLAQLMDKLAESADALTPRGLDNPAST